MHSGTAPGHEVLILFLSLAIGTLAGCITPDTTPDEPEHARFTVETEYDPQQTGPQNQENGLSSGSPAAEGRLFIHVVNASEYDEYEERMQNPRYDPTQPEQVAEGSMLTLHDDLDVTRYAIALGDDGSTFFTTPRDQDLVIRLELLGAHPSGSPECTKEYRVEEPMLKHPNKDHDVSLKFGIAC